MKTKNITVVTSSKNRTDNLIKSIRSCQKIDRINNHFILDFDSDENIKIDNKNITIFRIENEPLYWASRAYNALFNKVKTEYILKIDADTEMNSSYFNKLKYDQYDLVVFELNNNDPGNFIVKKEFIDKVNGFNEYIWSWGYEDHDLIRRIKSSKAKVLYAKNIVEKIEHPDKFRARVKTSKIFKNQDLFFYSLTKAYNDANGFLSHKNLWSKNNDLQYIHKLNEIEIKHFYDIRNLPLNIKYQYKYYVLKYFFKIYYQKNLILKKFTPSILFLLPEKIIYKFFSIRIFV